LRAEIIKLLRGTVFIFACRLAGAMLVFLTQIFLARWMGAEELGIYVFAFSLCILLSTVAGLGYPAAAVRFIGHGLAKDDMGLALGFIRQSRFIIISLSVAMGTILAGLLLSLQGSIPGEYIVPLMISLACIPILAMTRLNDRIAQTMSWFVLAYLPTFVLRPLLFFVAVFIVWRTGILLTANTALLIQFTVMGLVAIIAYIRLVQRTHPMLRGVLPVYETRLWSRTAAPLLMIVLFTQYFPDISLVLVGTILPSEDVAVFNASFRTVLLIVFGLNSVNAIISPRIAQLHAKGDMDELQRLVSLTSQIRFWPALVLVLALVFFGEEVLRLFGDAFVGGYAALVILSLSQLVIAAVGPVDVLLSITGHQDRCLRVFTLSLVSAVILNLMLVPIWGINGAAIAVFLVVVLWTTWLYYIVVRHLGIRPSIFSLPPVSRKSS
jgi:O-antigen/teichoic acid export membrane protein